MITIRNKDRYGALAVSNPKPACDFFKAQGNMEYAKMDDVIQQSIKAESFRNIRLQGDNSRTVYYHLRCFHPFIVIMEDDRLHFQICFNSQVNLFS